MSRRRRELLVPFLGFIASSISSLLSSKAGFIAGVVVGILAAVLCVYQCYRVLKARESPPRPSAPPARSRCARLFSLIWQLTLLSVTSWSLLIGVVRFASYFEANLLERGVCNWGCVRVSLARSDHCDDFCSPMLLKTDQQTVHLIVRRFLEELPRTTIVRTVEKESQAGAADSSASADAAAAASSAAAPSQYTYGVSLSSLVGYPSEIGVSTECMALPMGAGNSTGVLVSIQAQQLFRVGFPDVDGEKAKVRALLQVLREAADKGQLPPLPCS